ncbi:MAG: hypothetical protein H6606_09110 [Flavobacteriales bacterium]|nr:hypothetical protein [Flavobacteriales bacterium]
MKRQFQLDGSLLRKAYLTRSRENHPDFFMHDLQRHSEALEITSQNNKAYETLKDRDARISYLLQLESTGDSGNDKLPSDFLMEMMEWNERIMDAGIDGEEMVISTLRSEFEKLEKDLDAELTAACSAWDSDPTPEKINAVRELYLKTKYLLRIREALNKFAPH